MAKGIRNPANKADGPLWASREAWLPEMYGKHTLSPTIKLRSGVP